MAFDTLGKVKFKTQGEGKQETWRTGEGQSYTDFAGKFEVIGFNWGILCPKDPGSGISAGRRQHQPIAFTKNWGASTPQFFQAAARNEHIEEIGFEFFRTDGEGNQVVYMTIVAKNGSVSSIKYGTGTGKGDAGISRVAGTQYDLMESETIEVVFEDVTITHVIEGIEATDSWRS